MFLTEETKVANNFNLNSQQHILVIPGAWQNSFWTLVSHLVLQKTCQKVEFQME